MKQIAAMNLTRQHTEEVFGFLKLMLAEIVNLPTTGIAPALTRTLDTFKTAFNAFDTALKASSSNPSTADASRADEARDESWRKANNFLNVMCSYPEAEVAAAAREAKALFDKYGDPTKLAQVEESGVLHNLLQDLHALAPEKRTALRFDTWLDDLQAKEDAFLAAVARRTEEEAARQVGIVKETRTAAEAAYRSLTETVNALALINGDTEYATFIDHLNALIDRQRAILKSRTTRSQKTEEETPAE